jgi:hypothetical protein
MQFVREASLEEYAGWFLLRAAAGGDPAPVPTGADQQVAAMRERHAGKMRSWFNAATRWQIVELDVTDLANLVFLESSWTKENGLVAYDGLNYRTLRRVAERARASNYLSQPRCHEKQRSYYERLQRGELLLSGADRIAICSAEPSEISTNPAARYYLLDGVGRSLPYMMLLQERMLEHMRVEAFLAERGVW